MDEGLLHPGGSPWGEQQLLEGLEAPLPGAVVGSVEEAQPQVGLQRHLERQL